MSENDNENENENENENNSARSCLPDNKGYLAQHPLFDQVWFSFFYSIPSSFFLLFNDIEVYWGKKIKKTQTMIEVKSIWICNFHLLTYVYYFRFISDKQ